MTSTQATEVVDDYRERAPFARAETAAITRPRLLRGLLRTARHVAELPCGAGHFLADYADTHAEVTLIDGNPAMLAAAIEHAHTVGLPTDRTYPQLRLLQELDPLPTVDLVVMPNAALNQLACQTSLADLLTGIRIALTPGVALLAQVLCSHPGEGLDASGFYDPARQHGVWFADRYFNPTNAASAVLRRRRQRRNRGPLDRLHVEFDYQNPRGTSMHTTAVDLWVFSTTDLTDALIESGFGHIRFLPGHGGLSEILAATEGSARS